MTAPAATQPTVEMVLSVSRLSMSSLRTEQALAKPGSGPAQTFSGFISFLISSVIAMATESALSPALFAASPKPTPTPRPPAVRPTPSMPIGLCPSHVKKGSRPVVDTWTPVSAGVEPGLVASEGGGPSGVSGGIVAGGVLLVGGGGNGATGALLPSRE